MARIEITIDCADPESLADFWSAALGYPRRRSGRIYVTLDDPDDLTSPAVVLQRVAEPKVGKSRVHLDLYVDDLDPEVARLVALGAHALDEVAESGEQWVVLTDPEGTEFCVCRRDDDA